MLRKSFFTGAIMLIALLFGVTNSVSAGSARFSFNKNPWKLAKASANDAPENGKIEDNFEIKQDGFILTNKKFNEKNWNRLEGEQYAVYKDNKITITAPAGKMITRIEFQALSQLSFYLTNDEGIKAEESTSWDEDFGSDANDPIVFKMKAKKATFTGGSSTTRLVYIEIYYKDVPVEEEPKKEDPNTATFDFKNNFKTSWGITNVDASSTNSQEGKIEDAKEVVENGVSFNTKSNGNNDAARVKAGVFYLPKTHTLTFKAPQGRKIKTIEFSFETPQSWLLGPKNDNITPENKVATYQVNAPEVTFTAFFTFSKMNKIVVTLEEEVPAGISSVNVKEATNNNVYNLNGVLVGTENTFNQLPKGVYIVNGKKVVKN